MVAKQFRNGEAGKRNGLFFTDAVSFIYLTKNNFETIFFMMLRGMRVSLNAMRQIIMKYPMGIPLCHTANNNETPCGHPSMPYGKK